MAFLDSNGLKILTGKISDVYSTKAGLSAAVEGVETRINATFATKDEVSDVVTNGALSSFMTVDEATKLFLPKADAADFVEEYRLADSFGLHLQSSKTILFLYYTILSP